MCDAFEYKKVFENDFTFRFELCGFRLNEFFKQSLWTDLGQNHSTK